MRIVLQRVKKAAVIVEGKEKAAIGAGFLLLVGVGRGDVPETAEVVARKISKLRVFENGQGKMNMDIKEVCGEVLSVPQFTLLGKTEKGNRPGFDLAAAPAEARVLWQRFNDALRSRGVPVRGGEFGARMEVTLVNDGPVTFVIESE